MEEKQKSMILGKLSFSNFSNFWKFKKRFWYRLKNFLSWWFEEISTFCVSLICWSRICQPFSSITSGYFFMNDRNIYHFHQKSRDPGCIKFIIAENYVRNNDWQALKIGKMPPKQVTSTSLGYGRSSRSLYLLTFGGVMYRGGMN